MDITKMSTEEIEIFLSEKKERDSLVDNAKRPEIIEHSDIKDVVKRYAESILNSVEDRKFLDDDEKTYLFEWFISTFFGYEKFKLWVAKVEGVI